MKRWMRAAVGAVVVAMVLSFCGFAGVCAQVQESVVRLHVLANSDSEQDQALKLAVRDAVVAAGAGMLDGVTSRQEAERRLQAALPTLTAVAQACVEEAGFSYPVAARLTTHYFTTRTYGDITFPAGEYRTVQIVIGEGEGRNWWCVMYPPLCVSAATDKASLGDVMSADACDVVQQAPRYRVRFKLVELVTQFSEWLGGRR